ncbi:MAG: alpha/beta hydrolase [Kineosporiaceae bacterium]
MPPPAADVSTVLLPGPWQHRFVAANGARFHVAECGEGPLVLLLHGFPQFWWAWRHQLPALADAGFRAVALDLRGYGASDKPPRGYDTATLAGDVAGVARALGHSRAIVVGHDWGAWIAWSMPAYAPRLTQAVAAVSMPHPLRMRAAWAAAGLREAPTRRVLPGLLAYQAPMLPERALVSGMQVERVLRGWSARPGYPDAEELARYRGAMQVPFVAHSALEYFRWSMRSVARRDGRRFAERLRAPIGVPVLGLAGAEDPYVPPAAWAGCEAAVRAPWRLEVVPGAGHFLPEEAPDDVTDHLLRWLKGLPSTPGR